jgi:hypothetical protein
MLQPTRPPNARLFFGLLAAGLLSSSSTDIRAQEEASKPPPQLGPQAVFKPDSRAAAIEVWEKMQACASASARAGDPKFVACVVAVLQQAGASPEATAFTTLLQGEGYLDKFRKMGRVDLASVVYSIRANDNGDFLLVNGIPPLVHLEEPENLKHIDITKDPLYPALARKFPKLELWWHADAFKAMQHLAGGGQRFVFSFLLLNGCHACELGGSAQIAFDFDRSGRFLGTRLLRLSKVR